MRRLGTLSLRNAIISDHRGASTSAVDLRHATVDVKQSLFRDNQADFGGALFVQDGTTVNFADTVFLRNTARLGGAVFAENAQILLYEGVVFAFNTARGIRADDIAAGGAIFALRSTFLVSPSERAELRNNTAACDPAGLAVGGGIYLLQGELVANLVAIGNTACRGGAVAAELSPIVIGGEFVGNRALARDGGAAAVFGTFFESDAFPDYGCSLVNCRFVRNVASSGGAVSTDIPLKLVNSFFESNVAVSGSGGALFVGSKRVNPSRACDFTSNVASQGGGAVYSPVLNLTLGLHGCNFFANKAAYGDDRASLAFVLSLDHTAVTGQPGGLLRPAVTGDVRDLYGSLMVSLNESGATVTDNSRTNPSLFAVSQGKADLSRYVLFRKPGRYNLTFSILNTEISAHLDVLLLPCSNGSHLTSSNQCQVCLPGSVAALDGSTCKRCPASISCDLGLITAQRSIWIAPRSLGNDDGKELQLFICPRDMCLLDGSCSTNRKTAVMNPLCGQCQDNHMEVLGQCVVSFVVSCCADVPRTAV